MDKQHTLSLLDRIKSRPGGEQFLRFFWVGLVATAVHYLIMVLLVEGGVRPMWLASSIGFAFGAALNFVLARYFVFHSDVPWRHDVVDEGFTIDAATRTVTPNTRPGLGITINEDEVRKHPFQQELLQRVFYRDGAAGDW